MEMVIVLVRPEEGLQKVSKKLKTNLRQNYGVRAEGPEAEADDWDRGHGLEIQEA